VHVQRDITQGNGGGYTDMAEAMRQAFEAWAREQFGYTDFSCWSDDYELVAGEYSNTMIQVRWQAWQAATAAEREQCAKVCDAIGEWHAKTDMKLAYVADKCAEIIRAAAIRNRKEPA
jgi:hypothetical protein